MEEDEKFKALLKEWANKDSNLDEINLDKESLNTSKIFFKYDVALSSMKYKLLITEQEYNTLYIHRKEMYVNGAVEVEDIELAPRGKVLKSEVEDYLKADPKLQKKAIEVYRLQSRVDLLTNILKRINSRSFDVKNAIDFKKFKEGLN